ncbi:MAG: hypothetical protein ACLGIN_12395 [Candidatus Sericytochromatia bacterium]
MNRRSGRLLACLLVLGLVSACQTPIAAPERFALEAAASPSLVVRVKSPRRVQAVVEDVDHLLVTVKAADGREPTRRIEASEFSGSDASVTFTGLATGEATVEVRALSQTSQVLGQASVQATVTPGVLTQVDVPVQLDASHPQAGTGVATAAIALEIPLSDGDAVVPEPVFGPWGTVVDGYQEWGKIEQMGSGADGRIWMGSDSYARHFPDGGVGGGPASAGIAVDSTGRAWAASRYRSTLTSGAHTISLPAPPALGGLAIDGVDHLWLANGSHVTKFSSSGAELGRFSVGGVTGALSVDRASGDVWVGAGRDLVRLTADGTEAARAPDLLVPGDVWQDVSVDASGNAWAVQHHAHRVVKVAPDGTLLGRFKVGWRPGGIVCDGAGNAYVVNVEGVYKLASDGTVLGRHSFETSNLSIMDDDVRTAVLIDVDGDVWAAISDYTESRLLQVRP